MNAATQIGDDTLMASAGRTPVEASFTHGSSAQRMAWLRDNCPKLSHKQIAAYLSIANTYKKRITNEKK